MDMIEDAPVGDERPVGHGRGPTRMLGSTPNCLAEAAALLRTGRLVAFPTETVYGLGADATDALAIANLYAAKGRPSFNPLIAHVADADAAARLALFDTFAQRLAEWFWPGPLTLVLPAVADCPVCDLARAGLSTVAIRVPAHPLARDLLGAVGRPVAAPSANRSGHVSATAAAHVLSDLDGRIDAIMDGGPTPLGMESTIVACIDGQAPMLLRPGGVTREAIEAVIGTHLQSCTGHAERPQSPGQLASHYAPSVPVRLDADIVHPGEALLAFGNAPIAGASDALRIVNLSASGNLAEAAATLFAALRKLDAAKPIGIAVAPIPRHGIGEAIRDRLARAAAPRP